MTDLDWKKLNKDTIDALRVLRATSNWEHTNWNNVTAYNYLAVEAFGQATSFGPPDLDLCDALTPSEEQMKALEKAALVTQGGALPRDWATVEATINDYLGKLPAPLSLSTGPAGSTGSEYDSFDQFLKDFKKNNPAEYAQLSNEYKTSLADGGEPDDSGGESSDSQDSGSDTVTDTDTTDDGPDSAEEGFDGGRR